MYNTIEFHKKSNGRVHVFRALEIKTHTKDLIQLTTNLHPEDFNLAGIRNANKNTRIFSSSQEIWTWALAVANLQSLSAKSTTYFMSNPVPIVMPLHNQAL